jgi:hypothetical protein
MEAFGPALKVEALVSTKENLAKPRPHRIEYGKGKCGVSD